MHYDYRNSKNRGDNGKIEYKIRVNLSDTLSYKKIKQDSVIKILLKNENRNIVKLNLAQKESVFNLYFEIKYRKSEIRHLAINWMLNNKKFISKSIIDKKLFDELMKCWKKYHLTETSKIPCADFDKIMTALKIEQDKTKLAKEAIKIITNEN